MNIFHLDRCAKQSAEWHIDSHVNKLILESCQMMCTVLRENGIESPYKSTHKHHPMTKWVGESYSNFMWTLSYAEWLCEEFQYRKDKRHKSEYVVRFCRVYHPYLSDNGFTSPPQCMPESLHSNNYVSSYRNYYNTCKRFDKNGKFMYIWTKRQPPTWAIDPLRL